MKCSLAHFFNNQQYSSRSYAQYRKSRTISPTYYQSTTPFENNDVVGLALLTQRSGVCTTTEYAYARKSLA